MTYMSERMAEVASLTHRLQSEYPEETAGFLSFLKEAESGINVSAKNKELINVALSVAAQCEWCIAFHVKSAAKLGATKGELVEAGFQAVVMRGGPAFMWMTRLLQAVDEFVIDEVKSV
ncbi:MAG: carboxymuconolactone decarboxylase family protein [Candidimonas sp.]|nr:MAG: carboxymuconolactone decarboxylase family protein [Candidimonas sp.]TAM23923.1 MAG: carboxymuconolactone decarboxylase family protein [Candidimonas sp.]